MVILDLLEVGVGHFFQSYFRIWSLDRDLAEIVAGVCQRDVFIGFVRRYPLPILVGCRCIYHQKQLVAIETINKQIVDNTTVLVRESRVLCLAVN